MWSKQENTILQRNIEEYLTTNNIASAEEVFKLSEEKRKDFYRTIGIEKVNIKLSENGSVVVVARDITRPLFTVYKRVLQVYDKKNNRGR